MAHLADSDLELEPQSVATVLRAVTYVTGMRSALVARVTADSWVARAVYSEGGATIPTGTRLPRASTLCSSVCASVAPLLIRNLGKDRCYRTHPARSLYSVESYLGVPLVRHHGGVFGTLCSVDNRAVRVPSRVVPAVGLLGQVIILQAESQSAVRSAGQEIGILRDAAKLRERFMGVLGHDLRNPLAAIVLGAKSMLRDGSLDQRQQMRVSLMLRVGEKMSRMIADLLDLTRVRLGQGLRLERREAQLELILGEVIGELGPLFPDKLVNVSATGDTAGWWDADRINQMLSNLLSNALQYSPPGEAVEVALEGAATSVSLAVSNRGEPLPPEVKRDLFKPFRRAASSNHSPGLGLGLYIVKEVVSAHGGTISVDSTERSGTRVRVELPRRQRARDA